MGSHNETWHDWKFSWSFYFFLCAKNGYCISQIKDYTYPYVYDGRPLIKLFLCCVTTLMLWEMNSHWATLSLDFKLLMLSSINVSILCRSFLHTCCVLHYENENILNCRCDIILLIKKKVIKPLHYPYMNSLCNIKDVPSNCIEKNHLNCI